METAHFYYCYLANRLEINAVQDEQGRVHGKSKIDSCTLSPGLPTCLIGPLDTKGTPLKRYPDNINSDHSYVRGRDDMSTAARWTSGPGCALSGPGRRPLHPKDVLHCRLIIGTTVCWGQSYCMTCTLISGRLPYKGLLGAGNQLAHSGSNYPNRSLMQIPCPKSLPTVGIKRKGPCRQGHIRMTYLFHC